MPIGTGIVYNVGDLILSQVSSSGTAFLETKIAAATSSLIYFDSTARINSASLNSITVGTASYVSGSRSIITNITASNISASGTSSFGYVGIGTTSPSQKLHVIGDSIFNGLKTIQLDRTLAAAINSYTNIGNFARTHGAHSMIVSVTANISSYSVSKNYIINNAYNATGGSWRIALPITDSGPYNDDFQLLVNFDLEYCYLRLRKSSGSTYTGEYSITILYTGYTDTVFTATSTTGTDSSNLSILDSTQLVQIDGNVGIGTTSPVNKLQVNGNVSGSSFTSSISNAVGFLGTSSWAQNVISASYALSSSFATTAQTANALNPANSYTIAGLTNNGTLSQNGNLSMGSGNQILATTGTAPLPGIAFVGDTNTGIYSPSADTIGFSISGSERVRIDSNGNVGIGTTSPLLKLDVRGALQVAGGADGIYISNVGDNSAYDNVKLYYTGYNSGSPRIYLTPRTQPGSGNLNTYLYLQSNVAGGPGSNTMGLLVDGNVGIGTTSPGAKLDVNGDVYISPNTAGKNTFILSTNASNDARLLMKSDTTTKVDIQANGTSYFNGGNVGIGTTTINYRLEVYNSGAENVAKFRGTNDTTIIIGGSDSGGSGEQYITYQNITTATNAWMVGMDDGEDFRFAYGAAGEITDGNTLVKIDQNGNVGIGTTVPVAKLQVAGNISGSSFTSSISNAVGFLGTSSWAQNVVSASFATTAQTANALNPANSYTITNLTASNISASLTGSFGIVGIGTNSPATKLDVKGHIFVANAANGNNTIAFGNIGGLGPLNGAPDNLTGSAFLVVSSSTASGAPSHMKFYTTTGGVCGERMRIDESGNVGIGATVPAYKLDVSGTARVGDSFFVTTGTTADAKVEIGSGRTGNGNAYVDLIGDATYTDYGLRLIRSNGGANTTSAIAHRGTGTLYITAVEAASIALETSNTTRMTINSSGNVGIGTTSPSNKTTIEADATGVSFADNSVGQLVIRGATNTAKRLGLGIDTTNNIGVIQAQLYGTGQYPLVLNPAGGNVGIGTTNATDKLTVYGELASYKTGADTIQTQVYLANTPNTRAFNIQLNSAGTGLDLWSYNSANAWLRHTTFDYDGKVGIGTATSILGKLQLDSGAAPFYGPATGSATPNGIFTLGSIAGDVVNTFGVDASATAYSWIQSRKSTGATFYNLALNPNGGSVGIGTVTPAAKLEITGSSNSALLNIKSPISGAILYVSGSGAVGIGTSAVGAFTLQVSGSFGATTKSFIIDHPTKEGKKLMYGSLESPYHGIRLTGRDTIKDGKCKVELPDYMYKLILHDSINIQLTGIKCNKTLYVDEINIPENYFTIAYDKGVFESYKDYDFFWDFTAIRADVPELNTEL